MKKVLSIIVTLIVLTCDDVFAQTCEYGYEYLLYSDGRIDTTATAYKNEKVSFEIDNGKPSINIKNWENGRTTCPDYVVKKLTDVSGGFLCIGTTSTYSYWAFDSGIDWESDEAADAREFVDPGFCGSSSTKVFKNTNPETPATPHITCEYPGFKLEIDPDNHALSADSTQNSIALYYIYDVDGGLNDEWFYDDGTLGKCLDILVCYDKALYSTGAGSPTIMYYTVYMDELHVPRNEYGDNDCKKVSYSGDDESKKTDENTYKCTTYGNKINKIRDLYAALGSAKKQSTDTAEMYVEVEKEVYLLQVMCEAAYTTFNYSSDCVKECTGLEAELAQIKSSNGIDSVNTGSNRCSISERLANWIMKIVKWIRYLVPILLILLSIMDFIKAVASDSEDEVKKAGSKFVKRLIVAALIFLIPLILEFLLGIFGIGTNDYCL